MKLQLPNWIRFTPGIFYAVAVIDLAKNLLPLRSYLLTERFQGIDYSSDITPQLASIVMSAIIFAAGWFAYGVLVTIALGIYDRLDQGPVVIDQGIT